MPIVVTCDCGMRVKAPDALAGKKGKCPACGNALQVPPAETPVLIQSEPPVINNSADEPLRLKNYPPDDLAIHSFHAAPPEADAPDVSPQPAAPPPRAFAAAREAQSHPFWKIRYVLFSVALLPLVFSVFTKDDNVVARFQRTLSEVPPEVKEKIAALENDSNASEDSLFALLPGNRISGAYLSRSSKAHWIYAAISSAAFLAMIVFLFPSGNTNLAELIKVGLFTGTIGILVLLAVQYIAEFSQYVGIRGFGKLAILILIAKFIAFSYNAALDPENGFILSFIGFTCGVGLCEELCKAFPIVRHFTKTAKLDVNAALAWGLASGVGFGVSEGIHYAGSYNGVSGGEIYVIRFVSCVALHAMWCGAIGIALHRNQLTFQGGAGWGEMALPVLFILSVPMILHGLYDTLLKRDMSGWAVITAVASFAWLAYQIERARGEQGPSIKDARPARSSI